MTETRRLPYEVVPTGDGYRPECCDCAAVGPRFHLLSSALRWALEHRSLEHEADR